MISRALLIFLFITFAAPAFANQPLIFKDANGYKDNLILSALHEKTGKENIKHLIAKADLNNDAIDEYILKPDAFQNCAPKNFCPHYIYALTSYNPVFLGEFTAFKIIVTQSKTYGVRSLQIYNNPNNNFSYTLAPWEPFLSKYTLP